jgi:hypothetical protein
MLISSNYRVTAKSLFIEASKNGEVPRTFEEVTSGGVYVGSVDQSSKNFGTVVKFLENLDVRKIVLEKLTHE